VDRHWVWRRVESDYEVLTRRAPGDDYEVVVEAWLAGRPDPVELGWVETSRGPDRAWVRMQQHNRAFDDADEGLRHPGDLIVHVHESALLRVELRYAQKGGRPRAFVVREVGGEDDGEDEPA
jgi:hypothetical protein